MDKGVFPLPLKTPRRTITIQKKLEVLDYYDKLRKEKEAAMQQMVEPRPQGKTRAELQEFYAKKKAAKKQLRVNVQKMCKEKFPESVGKAQICKWRVTANMEGWRQLPQAIRCRVTATPNSWRQKLGLKLKGRDLGGCVPMALQRELDLLMVEVSSGLSEVSERRELVTVEQVAPCLRT